MNENLTPQIVAALLQDGTCKLTKAQMTAAVSAAVANLPKAYVFGGVAQPDLAPGSIPAPTLFVAVAVGAYGSFSNQSVDVGQIVFFTSDDGGAWALTLAYVPQPEPGPTPTTVGAVILEIGVPIDEDFGGSALTIASAAEQLNVDEAYLQDMWEKCISQEAVPIILKAPNTDEYAPGTFITKLLQSAEVVTGSDGTSFEFLYPDSIIFDFKRNSVPGGSVIEWGFD